MSARVSLSAYLCAFAAMAIPTGEAVRAQTAGVNTPPASTQLDPLTVEADTKKKKKQTSAKAAASAASANAATTAPQPAMPAAAVLNIDIDGTVTENSGSYAAENSTIGGKLVLPIKETPRSISVLTRKRLDDENITTVTEAAERATGVYVRNQGDASDGPLFYSRGFLMSVSENGVPLNTDYYGPGLDTAIYDRIEIIRGPDGLMQGQGQLGGSVNLVRKAPLATQQVKTELSAGQWNNYRSMLDVSTPLLASGAVRARVVGLAEAKDSFVDFVGGERHMGYGIIAIDISESTTISLNALSQKNGVNPYYGALHIPNTNSYTPRGTFLGARWSNFDYNRQEYGAELKHRFDKDWSLSATLTRRDYDDTKRFAFHNPHPSFHLTGTSGLINRGTWFEAEQWTGDAHLTGRFGFLGRKHDIVIGANFENFDHERWSRNAPAIGLWPAGDPNIPYAEVTKAGSTISKVTQEGLYAQGRFEIMPWMHAHLGARLTDYKSQSSTQGVIYDEANVFTPYGGLVVDVTREWMVYASYADIFRPQGITTTDASDATLPPIVGEQYEVGIKASLLDGALTPSLAFFRASDTGRPLPDPANPGHSIAAGEVLSEGFEVEVGARPVRGWELVSGYTYTETKFAAGQPGEVGTRFNSFYPKHTFKFWSNYAFSEGALDGVSLGVGLRAFSESTTSFSAPYRGKVSQPAYAVVDGRIAYKLDRHTELSLNVSNIFDEVYTPYPDVRAFYGEPRRAMARVATTW